MVNDLPSNRDPAHSSPALEPDVVIERVAAMAEHGVDRAEFYRQTLHDLVEATAGLGAAVWVVDNDGPQLLTQHRLPHQAKPSGDHLERLDQVLASGESRTFSDNAYCQDTVEILSPWRLGGHVPVCWNCVKREALQPRHSPAKFAS